MTSIAIPVMGIDNVSQPGATLEDYAVDLLNVDIRSDGSLSRRAGIDVLHATAEPLRGLWMSPTFGELCAVQGDQFGVFSDNFDQFIPLTTVGLHDTVTFTDHGHYIYAADSSRVYQITPGRFHAAPAGVRVADRPAEVKYSPIGNLPLGDYGVCVCLVNAAGEEGPASAVARGSTDASLGEGYVDNLQLDKQMNRMSVEVVLPPMAYGERCNVYMQTPGSELFHLATDAKHDVASVLVSEVPAGRACETVGLSPLPGGQFIAGQHGRLYIAQGSTLWFSQAMRPHLLNKATDFVQFAGFISLVAAMPSGIYVGDSAGVWWLEGGDPTLWTRRKVSDLVAVQGSLAWALIADVVENSNSTGVAALWMSAQGAVVGLPGGEITQLSKQFSVAASSANSAVTGASQMITLIQQ